MVPEQVPVSQLAKWGDAGRAGFQVIPNVLFRAQKHLGVDCVDILILLNLSLHWWGPYSLPYPSPALIAERMNVSKRTIERRLQTLEKSGFIKRLPAKAPQEGKPKVRSFEMSGLVAKLEEAALVGLVQREYRRWIERHKQQMLGNPRHRKQPSICRGGGRRFESSPGVLIIPVHLTAMGKLPVDGLKNLYSPTNLVGRSDPI
jgi:DNA-binding HxlR family transcriptional regulator